jgi:antitoxin Phd
MSSQPLPPLPGHPLESITATSAKNAFGRALEKALTGAVVGITRHEEISAVLLSAGTYRALIEALRSQQADPLAELRERFDRRFAAMQTPRAKAAARALFEATPQELGAAAVKGAKRRG